MWCPCMRELVDSIHRSMLEFAEQAGLEVDSATLRENVRRQLVSADAVVTPGTLERIGCQKLCVLIDSAARYDVTLGEMLDEAITVGCRRSAILARDVRNQKDQASKPSSKPSLKLVT